MRGRWIRFAALVLVTAVLLSPVLLTFWRALTPDRGGVLDALAGAFTFGPALTWLGNSAMVTAATVVVTVAVAAPAGYVLSRGRGRGVSLFALVIFALQALPIVLLLVPLFVLFAGLHLVDDLLGLTVVYTGLAVAVAIWTMGSAFDAIPVELEEAAWLDGCSVVRAFLRVVLPNAVPGVLSTAVFTFLLAWNDYWVAVVFIRTDSNYTVGIGLAASYGSPVLSLVALLPPLVVFVVLHRYFSLGGISGSLAGT
ncbi:MAG TPA: carbohydrate ABC transporter permease [Amnibacterium sp.]|nr:carbohydrate ABC transporter permease [Amnibacterium sp.]